MLESLEVSLEDGKEPVLSGDNGPTQIPNVSVVQQEQQDPHGSDTENPAKFDSSTVKPMRDAGTETFPPQNEISFEGAKKPTPTRLDDETTIRLIDEGITATPISLEGTPMTQKSANTMVSFSFYLFLWSTRL